MKSDEIPTLLVHVGVPEDGATKRINHVRTLAIGKEEYIVSAPGVSIREVSSSDDHLTSKAKRHHTNRVKKKPEIPRHMRYAKNPHEPIKC